MANDDQEGDDEAGLHDNPRKDAKDRKKVTITAASAVRFEFDGDEVSTDTSEAELGSSRSDRVLVRRMSSMYNTMRDKVTSNRKCRLRKTTLVGFCVHLAMNFWMWLAIVHGEGHLGRQKYKSPLPPKVSGIIGTTTSTIVFLCWGIFESIRVDSTRGMRCASGVFFAAWLHIMVKLVYLIVDTPQGWCPGYYTTTEVFLQASLQASVEFLSRAAIQSRIEVVEAAFEKYLGSRTIFWLNLLGLTQCMGPWCVSLAVFVAMPLQMGGCVQWAPVLNFQETGFVFKWYVAFAVVNLFSWGVTVWIVLKAYASVLKVAKQSTANESAYVKAELDWAKLVLQRARVSTMAFPCIVVITQLEPFLVSAIHSKSLKDAGSSVEFGMVQMSFLLVLELAAMLWLVGLFRPQRPQVHVHRSNTATSGVPSQSSGLSSCPTGLKWQRKVMELAHRSMSVKGLLDFYCLLGTPDVMPHYTPGLHTTNDVVRSAVIPLSRTANGGVAYASVVADDGAPTTMPDRMVTHDWRNTFLNLLAAIIADALGTDEYKVISEQLATGRADKVRKQLLEENMLGQRYWICAFCVNQHSSICGGYGAEPGKGAPEYQRWQENRHDSVTGDPLPVCDCGQRKIFNHVDEDLCELNKFDDLMCVLAAEMPEFTQVVAVDRNFGILSRLWCIAELVQAHVSGIPQQVKLLSMAVLDIDSPDLDVYARLANLRVSECHASRPEDKAFILGKIPDMQDFDARLHGMIFGDHGLLHGKLVGLDILHAAIRTVLRVQAASNRSQFFKDDPYAMACAECSAPSEDDEDTEESVAP